ncbi:hypothetical protein STRTUCAR8_07303 [Streptomyces turgidiscabies Car8]|uniref:Uncharacterized protein n=1 Tax=Streptomyces turgidiscabies (strain Car8) TaxID=698760 RepID=L7EQG4_STRT8|nr:hypothetical protein STRTUCAR8_07303 [Streptomyces turgidiscabies Car8]
MGHAPILRSYPGGRSGRRAVRGTASARRGSGEEPARGGFSTGSPSGSGD